MQLPAQETPGSSYLTEEQIAKKLKKKKKKKHKHKERRDKADGNVPPSMFYLD